MKLHCASPAANGLQLGSSAHAVQRATVKITFTSASTASCSCECDLVGDYLISRGVASQLEHVAGVMLFIRCVAPHLHPSMFVVCNKVCYISKFQLCSGDECKERVLIN